KAPSRWVTRAWRPEMTRLLSGITQSQSAARPITPPRAVKRAPGSAAPVPITSKTSSIGLLLLGLLALHCLGFAQGAVAAVAPAGVGAAGQRQRDQQAADGKRA